MRSDRLRRVTGHCFLAAAVLALAGCLGAANPFYDPAKYHHTPEGFRKPKGSPAEQSHPFRFLAYLLDRLTFSGGAELLPPDSLLSPGAAKAMLARHEAVDRVSWIGHASVLIGLDGVNILTDPNFSPYPIPIPIAFKRFAPPGLSVADLPRIHVIVISHNHYDSLDMPSLRQLAARFPRARVLVPLGLAGLVREAGFSNVREMDWYDRERIGPVQIQATPAIHNSARGVFDKNRTLWSGFAFRGKKLSVWFTGDTALGPVFDEVRHRIGAMDVALVPIGAYAPGWLMRHKHTSPEEAAELARRVEAPLAIGIHWGTFPLGSDNPREAKERFLATAKPGFRPRLLKIGETLPLHPNEYR